MPMKYLFLFVVCFLNVSLYAQEDIIFKNPKQIDKNRYGGTKGSCLVFDEWVSATLYDMKGMSYHVPINYNSDTNFLEAKKNEQQYINVRVKEVPRAVVYNMNEVGPKELMFLDSLVLIHGPQLKTNSSFHGLLHKDDDKVLFIEFYVALSVITESLPGEVVERKRFNKKYHLILQDGPELIRFPVSSKKAAKALQKYGNLIKWCKTNKLKPGSFEGIVAFLKAN